MRDLDTTIRSTLKYDPISGILTRYYNKTRSVGTLDKDGYLVMTIYKKQYRVHNVCWFLHYGSWPKRLDHINRKRDDNCIVNLREATILQNAQNRSNAKGVTGITWHKTKRIWQVSFRNKTYGPYPLYCRAYSSRKKLWDEHKT